MENMKNIANKNNKNKYCNYIFCCSKLLLLIKKIHFYIAKIMVHDSWKPLKLHFFLRPMNHFSELKICHARYDLISMTPLI